MEFLLQFLFRGGGIALVIACMITATIFSTRRGAVILAAGFSIILTFLQSGCWALWEVANGIGKATGGGGRGANNAWWMTICLITFLVVIVWTILLMVYRSRRLASNAIQSPKAVVHQNQEAEQDAP